MSDNMDIDTYKGSPPYSQGFNLFGLLEHVQERIIQFAAPPLRMIIVDDLQPTLGHDEVVRNLRATHPIFNKFVNQNLGAIIHRECSERKTWKFNLSRDSIVVNEMKVPRLAHNRVSDQMFGLRYKNAVFKRIISINFEFRNERSDPDFEWTDPQSPPDVSHDVGDLLQDFPHLEEFTFFVTNTKRPPVHDQTPEIFRQAIKLQYELPEQAYPLALQYSDRPMVPPPANARTATAYELPRPVPTRVRCNPPASDLHSLWLGFRYVIETGLVQFSPLRWPDIQEAFEVLKQREMERPRIENLPPRMPTSICKLWIVRLGDDVPDAPERTWVDVNTGYPNQDHCHTAIMEEWDFVMLNFLLAVEDEHSTVSVRRVSLS